MLNTSHAPLWSKTFVVLTLLLSACVSAPVSSPQPVERAKIPPLPEAAKQPTPPASCSPTCSYSLTSLRVKLRDTPIRLGSPASPASAPTKP